MTRANKVVIVGAGLYGSLIGKALRDQGRQVTIVDQMLEGSGSQAAGCVLRPSWLSSTLGREATKGAYATLDELYGLRQLEFDVQATGKMKVGPKWKLDWVPPTDILSGPDIHGKATEVGNGYIKVALSGGGKTRLTGIVIVAAGIWSRTLVPVDVVANWGVALRFSRDKNKEFDGNRLVLLNPFRQVVAFPITRREIWFGDGTKLKDLFDYEKSLIAVDRAENMFGLIWGRKVIIGARPVTPESKTGVLKQLDSRLWVATGGGKVGLALAAQQASILREKI